MLVYFKVSNFKSIKDEITLNFNSTSLSEHEQSNLIKTDRTNLLKSIILFGHNASGKSKVLDALVFFRWFVLGSASDMQSNDEIDVEPFEKSKTFSKKPSSFEICFILNDQKYRYGFVVDKHLVHKEWLLESKYKKEYSVFLRLNQSFQLDSKRFPNALDIDKKTRKNALFLSVAAKWNVPKAEKIDRWFRSIYTLHGIADSSYRQVTIDRLKDSRCKNIINRFIHKADLGINSIETMDIEVKAEDLISKVPEKFHPVFKETYKNHIETVVLTNHNVFNDNNDVVDNVTFILDKSESEGTKKLFNILGVIVTAIIEDRLLIIDEFDGRLHTLLSKSILKLFNSEKILSKAQLLVSSHDTALLDSTIFRRDQIYFVEKSIYGASSVTSLVEYKPRKETPFDKNYLDGKYGALPFIDDLESLFNDCTKKNKANI
jgi:AAA15 family ATPase/GTPase